MNARTFAAGALAALAVACLAGCSKSPTSPGTPSSLDQSQVTGVLAASATLVDDGIEESTTQVSASTDAAPDKFPVGAAAIKPFAWWQQITGETRTWTFTFADTDGTGRPTTCTATLVKHLTGSLVVVPQSPSDSTQPDPNHVTKALDKTVTRQILLKRLTFGAQREWRVVALTGGFMTTPGAVTQIVSLHIHSTSGVDITITDPQQFFPLRGVIAFGPQDTVTVTARTLLANDAVFIHRWDWRHRLHNNLDDTYSFTWVTSPWGGWRHFAIQAMSHGSIYDDTLPFDSEAWHLPFRVVGYQTPVDYYP